ncbi:G5 domain-containing protein [Microbacterium jejuense]|uniref:G5 domain-containing protein n=2 Tax=Microbacterium jejuense TaxID=1263637 RepID=A0ABS7HUX8_9MICO|nr:G5 domain-containing protein [Microbacterium jejuense]
MPTPTPTAVATTRDEVVTEPIPFTESRVDDATIPSGQTQVRTAGQDGEKTLTYRVHLLDGEEVSRELVAETVTREPVTQVIAVGTYVAPPPPPAPAPAAPVGGCDPNYADACVPISSDVDCAGGSGNGPAYFDGIARVVGNDVYDLDRDGDGFACEPY